MEYLIERNSQSFPSLETSGAVSRLVPLNTLQNDDRLVSGVTQVLLPQVYDILLRHAN